MLFGDYTQKITPLILWMDYWLHPTWLNADNDGNPDKIPWGLASDPFGRPSDHSGRPSDHSGRPSDPSSRPSDPSSWPSDPLDRGWRDEPRKGQTDGLIDRWMDRQMDGRREFLSILQDFVPCQGRCPATFWDFTTSKKQGKVTAAFMMHFGNWL